MDVVISNLLLTRCCPLKCEHCRIVRDYKGSPYPKVSSYGFLKPEQWLKIMDNLEALGCVFHTIYGGEPSLYPQLFSLVNMLNKRNKFYTFITSGVEKEKWFKVQEQCGLKGISASVDIWAGDLGDREKKSRVGGEFLFEMKERGVKDVVAVTVLDEKNIQTDDILEMVKLYSGRGIYVEITLIDEPHNDYYDFAEPSDLGIKSPRKFSLLMDKLYDLKSRGFLIHNNEEFFTEAKRIVDGGVYMCKKPWSSMTVEPDGTIRLCYRIGGAKSRFHSALDFDKDRLLYHMSEDQFHFCKGCTWNCVVMSDSLSDKEERKKVFRHNQ